MKLLGQFKTSLFILRKNFARTKTQIKLKPTNFLCLRSFYAQKIFAFIVFSSLNFISLVGFGLIWVFVSAKSFPKIQKKKNWFEIVLITSCTILLTCTPINSPIEGVLVRSYFYLWSSVRISSFYENPFESFLFVRISSYLWSSVRICFF